jgi:hypothetical protein
MFLQWLLQDNLCMSVVLPLTYLKRMVSGFGKMPHDLVL